MPTGTRIRANNVYGVTSDNPLTSAAATFNSVSLPLLPVVASAHAVIVLDPKRVYGDPEIVVVTAHTAASTVASILRGQYSTSARQHPQGTSWAHVPVTDDWTQIVTSVTRPSDPYRGQTIFETDTNAFISRATSDTWQMIAGNMYSFRATNNAVQNLTGGSGLTTINFQVEQFDFGNGFATNTFNVPFKGLWFFHSYVTYSATATGDSRHILQINRNGIEFTRQDGSDRGTVNGDTLQRNASGIQNCLAGDTVVSQFNAVTGNVQILSPSFAYFEGYYIGTV